MGKCAQSKTNGISHDYRGASSEVDAELYKEVYDAWVVKAREINAATGANATFVPQHIPKSTVEIGIANGGNPLGLQPTTQQCRFPHQCYVSMSSLAT